MKKKTVIFTFLAIAAVLAAGISVGVVHKLTASDASVYRNKVLSKDTFEISDTTLYYVEPDEEMKRRYPDRIIYRDDNKQYYHFDADTQELEMIYNNALDDKEYSNLIAGSIEPYSDTEALSQKAKELISKWSDVNLEDFKWESRTDDLGDTSFGIIQVINDDFSVSLAEVTYDMDGDFRCAIFDFDSKADLTKKNNFISKDEAIEKAKSFAEKEYGKTDWDEISIKGVGGKQLYWEILLKKTEIITTGYYVGVDLLTGETWLEDTMR